MKKKAISLLLAGTMVLSFVPNVFASEINVFTQIMLSDDGVTVDSEDISTTIGDAVYLAKTVETHPDVAAQYADTQNSVITITQAGTYKISGNITNGQIKVDADDDDQVKLILNGANITCNTAPAILIASAYDPEIAGKSGVTIELADKTENVLIGSHIAEYYDEDGNKVKADAALSTKVSLTIEGEGSLLVNADNEGIESKLHLTINSGDIKIYSGDDAVNASEDGVSYLIINGGTIYANSTNGAEGDGMDSNGYITINGGTVVGIANPQSMDSGLDSDLGITINAGTVISTGNMFEEISSDSAQNYMQVVFATKQEAGTVVEIKDADDKTVASYTADVAFTDIAFSNINIVGGDYTVYVNGEKQQCGGSFTNDSMPAMNEDGTMPQPPEGMEMPNGVTPSEMHEGEEMPEGMTPPEGGFGGEMTQQELTEVFTVTDDNHVFRNVMAVDAQTEVAVEETKTEGFTDVAEDAWYKAAVDYVKTNALFAGVSDTKFDPNGNITRAMAVTVLYRLKGETAQVANAFADVAEDSYYAQAVAWGSECGVVSGVGNSKFSPDSAVTREQLAVMIYNYANSTGIEIAEETAELTFDDNGSISDWATEGVCFCVNQGLLSGKGNNELDPKATATRAEVAAVIQRFAESIAK